MKLNKLQQTISKITAVLILLKRTKSPFVQTYVQPQSVRKKATITSLSWLKLSDNCSVLDVTLKLWVIPWKCGSQFLHDRNLRDQTSQRSKACHSTAVRRVQNDFLALESCCTSRTLDMPDANPFPWKSSSPQSRLLSDNEDTSALFFTLDSAQFQTRFA